MLALNGLPKTLTAVGQQESVMSGANVEALFLRCLHPMQIAAEQVFTCALLIPRKEPFSNRVSLKTHLGVDLSGKKEDKKSVNCSAAWRHTPFAAQAPESQTATA